MKNTFFLRTIFGLLIFTSMQNEIAAQSQAVVKNIEHKVENDKMIINYDILNYLQDETFKVTVKIETVSGNIISPASVQGDVGEKIPGGVQKTITWNYTQDNFSTNDEYFVAVNAISDKAKNVEKKIVNKTSSENLTMAGALVRSAVIPGWGLGAITGKGAYWFLGVAGYGLLAGSIGINKSAAENYDNYLLEYNDPEMRADYYDKAVSQDKLSKNLAIAAGVIWVGNLVWTGIVASKNPKTHANHSKGFHFGSSYLCDNSIPIFGLNYKF